MLLRFTVSPSAKREETKTEREINTLNHRCMLCVVYVVLMYSFDACGSLRRLVAALRLTIPPGFTEMCAYNLDSKDLSLQRRRSVFVPS